jgi:hypothetical protein
MLAARATRRKPLADFETIFMRGLDPILTHASVAGHDLARAASERLPDWWAEENPDERRLAQIIRRLNRLVVLIRVYLCEFVVQRNADSWRARLAGRLAAAGVSIRSANR